LKESQWVISARLPALGTLGVIKSETNEHIEKTIWL
jgi:hypothetical protein